MVFRTLRLCIPLLLSCDFGVRPCIHTATSFLDLRVSSTFSLCGTSSGTSAPLLFSLFCLSCFVTLVCFVNSLCFPAVGYALVSWVLGSQSLAVLFSSRPFGTCFIQPNPMISMPTSPSESLLLFTPWNQLNFDVTGFKNTLASRDNRSCHFPRTTGIVHNSVDVLILLHLLSRELHHDVSKTRSTSCPSSTEWLFSSLLAHGNRLCLTPRHAHRCLLRF